MAVRPVTTVLGLCAGVGGLELGIMLGERLRGRDVRGVCYVEREAAGAASLVASMDAGWFHPAPVWSDLATFDGGPWRGRVHTVASGDPCQGNSVPGKGLGANDPRFLIPHVLRIVGAVRPVRVFRENVTGNAAGQLAALVGPLEDMGYCVAAGIFSSARAGNSHRRERLIVMADRDGVEGWLHPGPGRRDETTRYAGRCSGEVELADADRPRRTSSGCGRSLDAGRQPQSRRQPVADAASRGCDPGFEEPAGEVVYLSRSSGPSLAGDGSGYMVAQLGHADRADVDWRRKRLDPIGRQVAPRHARLANGAMVPPAIIPGPDDRRWADIIDRLPQLAPALSEAEAQSLLRGGIDAVAYRIERLRAIGNGVDPVVGATAWLRLGALLDANRAGRPAVRAA